jgi:hypothetical protein
MLKILVLVLAMTACKHPGLVFNSDAGDDDDDDGGSTEMTCAEQGLPPTTINGTVFAPNESLPLYGADVYIPITEPGPLPSGSQCARCSDPLPGGAMVHTISNDKGEFVLSNVPAGASIPLVIQIGKWRRRVSVPVAACQANVLSRAETSLPGNRTEGDMPKMAFVSGACDPSECVLRKLGIDDSEFTSDTGPGSVHLYTTMGATSSLADGTPLTNATVLWSDLNKLKSYDVMFLGCECSQQDAVKTQQMFDNIQAYADLGGRIYATHYQSIWIDGKTTGGTPAPTAEWQSVLSCPMNSGGGTSTTIDQINNPKGVTFATWLVNTAASGILGTLPIQGGAQTCDTVDLAIADRWMYQGTKPQMIQFTTPLTTAKPQRCGKVTFSDMHSTDAASNAPFPNGCEVTSLTPQQKALAFVLFELSACTGQQL